MSRGPGAQAQLGSGPDLALRVLVQAGIRQDSAFPKKTLASLSFYFTHIWQLVNRHDD